MKTSHYTEDDIRQAVEQGPITDEYQADPQYVIEALNRLRATEITSFSAV